VNGLLGENQALDQEVQRVLKQGLTELNNAEQGVAPNA
jgi:hypothetical protein